jgi:hypothetical protein
MYLQKNEVCAKTEEISIPHFFSAKTEWISIPHFF